MKLSELCVTQFKHSKPPDEGEAQKRSRDFLRGRESPGSGDGLADLSSVLPKASLRPESPLVRGMNLRESAWRRHPWK